MRLENKVIIVTGGGHGIGRAYCRGLAREAQLVAATRSAPVTVHADTTSEACKFGLAAALLSSHGDHGKPCVQAKKLLIGSGINFSHGAPVDGQADVHDGQWQDDSRIRRGGLSQGTVRSRLSRQGRSRKGVVRPVFLLVVMTVIVAMVYGPVASFLVEMFPANIRYTALSFPYHIGAGIFGGFLPFFATYLSLAVGDVFAGLWYPVVICTVVAVIGSIMLPNRPQIETDHSV